MMHFLFDFYERENLIFFQLFGFIHVILSLDKITRIYFSILSHQNQVSVVLEVVISSKLYNVFHDF